jgi:hypothetical protein
MDQGETFEEISQDLSNGRKDGDVSYGTISCIAESPFKFGYIYAGTDDGTIHITKDGGESWTKISNKLPQNLWVQEVIASQHKKERVYAVLNGHTWDHFNSYIFRSNDYGNTWEQIGNNLPKESLNTLIEDATNEDILYLGSDAALYISVDQGAVFQSFSKLPPVAIHDLAIQKENRDLIVGTHGRSIYKIQLEPVYQSATYTDSGFVFLEMDVVKYNENWGKLSYAWKVRTPNKEVVFFLEESGLITLQILDDSGALLLEKNISGKKGYNSHTVELQFQENPNGNLLAGKLGKYYPAKGRYTVRLNNKESTLSRTLIVQ